MTHARALLLCIASCFSSSLYDAHGQTSLPSEASDAPGVGQLLSRVPSNASWQDLAPDLRDALQRRASSVLAKDRQAWGLSGLKAKEDSLFASPTPAMVDNIDRILTVTFASELPNGFKMARDVSNTDLKRQLIRIYLSITDDRGFMLTDHPDFKGWDGMPVKELWILDHEHSKAMAGWLLQTEDNLRKIPGGALNALETALRAKSFFKTRAGKYFEKPAVAMNGSLGYSVLYRQGPFQGDDALLDAYNASMFSEFREVNIGTLDAFLYDYESEYNREWLKKQGMPETLIDDIIKLGNLYLTRVQAHPDRAKRCTVFSAADREANWDAFTAGQVANADGSETLKSYAKIFETIALQRLSNMQSVGRLTLDRLFPDGSPELTNEHKRLVGEKLANESRPAMMLDTLLSTLDQVTGSTAASAKVKDAIEKQPTVGGNYLPGQAVREGDKALILDMWKKIRAFVAREYKGYRVDIAELIPVEPIIVPSGQNQFTFGGQVNISLGTAWNLVSLSSTLMHEVKHAIDQNSHASVEGAAIEGGATSIERQVWPIFIEEAMAGDALLPVARLKTEIDNVRFTATTDATLKILLRENCGPDEPDSIAFAEQIVHGYGYEDREILRLRSRRAHRSTQYLQYDYGLAMFTDLVSFLQHGVGPTPRVDGYLLQACGMPSPKKDIAAIESLKACIRERKS